MDIIYGPVQSRRLGLSLGINPLGPQKVCSFDCPYCGLGRTEIRMNQIKKDIRFPTVEDIESKLREKIQQLSLADRLPQNLTVSGNGEPTLYPQFLELTERLIAVRDELCSQTPVVILTNGAHIDNRKMVHALDLYDQRMVKVDAGSDKDFKLINSPLVRANISKIISGARKLRNCVVQAMFVQGKIDNTEHSCVEDWMEVVGIIQPREVHIYTLKKPAPEDGILAATEDALYTVASKLKRRTQLEAKVFT